MSGLAGILAGHRPPGVYTWHSAEQPDDVRHAVETAGWRFGYVDGWTHQDKRAFLEQVAAALAFPEWFGHNFDALVDCLRDVAEPTVLLWDGWGPLAREDRRAFGVAVDVFNQRATEHRAQPFAVLLRGEGPDTDVPPVD